MALVFLVSIFKLYRTVKALYFILWCLSLSILALYKSGFDSREFIIAYVLVLADLALFILIANVKLHNLAVKQNIKACTLGLKATVLSCLFLTPLEAVIVLPAINLYRLKGQCNKTVIHPKI